MQINAADARLIGMADYAVADTSVDAFMDKLASAEFAAVADGLNLVLTELNSVSEDKLPASNIAKFEQQIQSAMAQTSLTDVVAEVSKWLESDEKWLNRAAKTLVNGSPVTQRLVWEQLQRGKQLSLADCFRMELIMACRCASAGEFQEGVRALLIDKDGAPNWLYPSQDMIPDEFIASFFTGNLTEQSHPLANLGVA